MVELPLLVDQPRWMKDPRPDGVPSANTSIPSSSGVLSRAATDRQIVQSTFASSSRNPK